MGELRAPVLGILAAVLASALLWWLALAPLEETIRGTGRIVPQAKTQVIQHLEGGIVEAILVHEGQTVTHNQPLFRLHDQSARTAKNEQAIGARALTLKKLRLEAEQTGALTLSFPADLAAAEPDMAAAEQRLFQARRDDFSHQVEILHTQMQQKRLAMMEIQNQIQKLQEEKDTAQQQYDINRKLRESGALSESRLLESQAQVQNLATRITQAQGQLPVTRAEVAELEKREKQVREERQSKIADELATVSVQLQQGEEREKSFGDRLERTTVLAPAAGIVNRLLVTTVGGVVQPGAALAELTPTEGPLVVEGKVGARDRARIWNGQPVTVRVSAYDYAAYGSLKGVIRDISADSLRDEQTGTIFYRVTIDLPISQTLSGQPLMPGMTVDFYIRGERHSALWSATLPLRKIFLY